MPDIWQLAGIATTFAVYVGLLTSSGIVLCALLLQFTPERRLIGSFATLSLLATVLGFLLGGAQLTDDLSGMTDQDMLGLLWSTPVGTAAAMRVIGLGLLICGLFAGRNGLILSGVGSAVALSSFTQIGHIADRENLVLNICLLIHLTAVSFWIGILTPLHQLAGSADTQAEAAQLGHRFGKVASVFVPLLIFAGGYMSYQLVGSFAALTDSGYGQVLLFKSTGVAVLLGLAAANKLAYVPQLRSGDLRAAKGLRRTIRYEWCAFMAILLATAVLTSGATPPN